MRIRIHTEYIDADQEIWCVDLKIGFMHIYWVRLGAGSLATSPD